MSQIPNIARALVIAAISAPAAIADPLEEGRRHYLRCIACHAIGPSEPARFGPHMGGILGRPAAGLADYPYTEAVRGLDFDWDAARLDQWLEHPQEMVSGMCLPFLGLPDPEARAALLAYLAALDEE